MRAQDCWTIKGPGEGRRESPRRICRGKGGGKRGAEVAGTTGPTHWRFISGWLGGSKAWLAVGRAGPLRISAASGLGGARKIPGPLHCTAARCCFGRCSTTQCECRQSRRAGDEDAAAASAASTAASTAARQRARPRAGRVVECSAPAPALVCVCMWCGLCAVHTVHLVVVHLGTWRGPLVALAAHDPCYARQN